jgi:hypothetical protein
MKTFLNRAVFTQQTKKMLIQIKNFIINHSLTFPSFPAVAIISECSDEISKSLIER